MLLFCLAALLSIPLAIDPGMAWDTFSGNFIKAVLMFVVMVNAVRTERRLKVLILLALTVSLFLSVGALEDYYSGNLTVESDLQVGGSTSVQGNLSINGNVGVGTTSPSANTAAPAKSRCRTT